MIDGISDWFDITPTQARLLFTAVVIVVLFLARWVMVTVVKRHIDDAAVWYRTRKLVTYITTLVAAVVIALLWVKGSGLATYIGFLTAGIAIALSDVLKNLAGWLYIVVRRPFRLGERIETMGHKGDVVDIRAFRFTLFEIGTERVDAEQPTGRLLHMPNGILFTEPVANYTEGFRYLWLEIPVLITFESDWEAAEQILQQVAEEAAPDRSEVSVAAEIREAAYKYRIGVTMLDPVVFLSVRDSGVLLTARVVASVGRTRIVEQEVWKGFLRAIADRPEIQLAYPTVRTHLQGPVQIDRPE